jgi:hypothetical protein
MDVLREPSLLRMIQSYRDALGLTSGIQRQIML